MAKSGMIYHLNPSSGFVLNTASAAFDASVGNFATPLSYNEMNATPVICDIFNLFTRSQLVEFAVSLIPERNDLYSRKKASFS